jgi:hypothetical protein
MDIQFKKEIGKALSARTYAYVKKADRIQCMKTHEWDRAGEVKLIEDLVIQVIRSTEVLFSMGAPSHVNKKYIREAIPGRNILLCLKISIPDIKEHYPIHQFNPYVDMFFRHVESRHLDELPWMLEVLTDDELVKWCGVLNDFIAAIRQEAKNPAFKKTMSEFTRLSNKNFRELRNYINALFEQHSRLLVLRIDFGYLKEYGKRRATASVVEYGTVKKDWQSLLLYLRRKLPHDCLLGFAWKLEYGLEKSFHYHVLLMLDGSKVREDVTIARLIGDHWNETITKGKGLYYNCNAFKEGYKFCGIGMINHSDMALREGLEKAALYLTKPDYYIKLIAPDDGRTFGKGNMPKPRTGSRGRPRTKSVPKENNLERGIPSPREGEERGIPLTPELHPINA